MTTKSYPEVSICRFAEGENYSKVYEKTVINRTEIFLIPVSMNKGFSTSERNFRYYFFKYTSLKSNKKERRL